MDSVLDFVARHEMYSFLDGFSGYNQVRMQRRSRKYGIRNGMECIPRGGYDVQVENRAGNVPAIHFGSIR